MTGKSILDSLAAFFSSEKDFNSPEDIHNLKQHLLEQLCLLAFLGILGGMLTMLVLGWSLGIPVFLINAASLCLDCLLCLVARWLARRKNYRPASWLLIGAMLKAASVSYFFLGPNLPIPLVFMVPIITAILFMQPLETILVSAYCLVFSLAIIFVESFLGLFQPAFDLTSDLQAIMSAALVIIIIPLSLVLLLVPTSRLLKLAHSQNLRLKVDIEERKKDKEALVLARQETLTLNQELEERVVQRTWQLEEANQELMSEITSRKRLEEELTLSLEKEKELSELKSRFVSMASHEFRTPLTIILSTSELLEHYNDKWTVEKRHQLFQRIQEAVSHMTGLLEDILVLGQADEAKIEVNPVRLDLGKFCREHLQEAAYHLISNHRINFSSPAISIEALLDKKLLRHIFANLFSNAFKYSPGCPEVWFELACEEGWAVIRVRDQGIGIPPEDLKHMFEPFHRAANTGEIGGTGLGLTIVKRFVEIQAGQISVESLMGAGTTVTVRFPMVGSR